MGRKQEKINITPYLEKNYYLMPMEEVKFDGPESPTRIFYKKPVEK
jgi:hypothetical protein